MTIDIAASISITGKFAARGDDYAQAYSLWEKSCNAVGGLLDQQVRVKLFDDESDPDKARANIRDIAATSQSPVVLGPSHTRTARAAVEEAVTQGLIMLQATHGSSALFEGAAREGHFLCWPGCDADYAIPYIDHVAKTRAPGCRIALLATDGRLGRAVSAGAKAQMQQLGLGEPSIIDLPAEIGEAGIQDAAREAMASHDVILGCLDHARPDAPPLNILRVAEETGFPKDHIWLSDHPSMSDQDNAQLYEGVWMRVVWWPDFVNPSSLSFCEGFQNHAGSLPGFHAAGGYACGQVLRQAAAFARSLDRNALLDALTAHDYETVFGTYGFAKNGRPQPNIRMGRWQDGEFVTQRAHLKAADALETTS